MVVTELALQTIGVLDSQGHKGRKKKLKWTKKHYQFSSCALLRNLCNMVNAGLQKLAIHDYSIERLIKTQTFFLCYNHVSRNTRL